MERDIMPGDGNCFYHAVGKGLGRTHIELREKMVDFILSMSDDEWAIMRKDFYPGERQEVSQLIGVVSYYPHADPA
jgi:hypothetical protein